MTFVASSMSDFAYNTITESLLIGVLIALVIALFSLVAMIFRWRTPRRRRHLIRLLVSLAAVPCFIGIQQGILRLVVLPAIGRQMTARYNEARAARLAHAGPANHTNENTSGPTALFRSTLHSRCRPLALVIRSAQHHSNEHGRTTSFQKDSKRLRRVKSSEGIRFIRLGFCQLSSEPVGSLVRSYCPHV